MTELGQAIEATPQVLNFFKAYWTTFQERQKRERLRAVLHELNDLQLNDIGIARGEIERSPRTELSTPAVSCEKVRYAEDVCRREPGPTLETRPDGHSVRRRQSDEIVAASLALSP